MLAPRKTLWSTPISAVDYLMKWIPLKAHDCVCDIGCGDGRILLEWAIRHYQLQQKQQSQEENDDESSSSFMSQLYPISFVGIDIDPERIAKCHLLLQQAIEKGEIDPMKIKMEFYCANALDLDSSLASASNNYKNVCMEYYYQQANIFFLYLIPRGLKLIYPLLMEQKQKRQECKNATSLIQVVTYMSQLPCEERPIDRALLSVPHQPEAAWPLYYYQL